MFHLFVGDLDLFYKDLWGLVIKVSGSGLVVENLRSRGVALNPKP